MLVAAIGGRNPDQVNSLSLWFAPIGILLALFLPGYALAVGLFPQFDGAAVFLLSIGLSLVVDVLGGLFLNFTPWGLQPISWAILLGGVAIIGSFNTVIRRRARLASEPELEAISPPWSARVVVLFGIALVIVVLTISLTLNDTKGNEAFTQLWAIPSSEDGFYAINIGVSNHEGRTMHYELYIEEGGARLQDFPDIALIPGETWTNILQLDEHPQDVINIYLYRLGNTQDPYRAVRISPISFDYVMTPTPTLPSP
ncbi:MAG: DUF1616 domain-containing protein [Chloroflexi bacterium]|nr:DUF1616 domain-containing protein [Chloroflexota bacterium]